MPIAAKALRRIEICKMQIAMQILVSQIRGH